MKKLIPILLALALLLGCAASAEVNMISGNTSTGGVAAVDADGALWYSMEGLMCLRPDGSHEKIAEGDVHSIQFDGEALWYVCRQESGLPDEYTETLWTIGADGEPVQIGPALKAGQLSEYDPEDYSLARGTTWCGYGDMTVCGDYIYYIGTDDEPGIYHTNAQAWDYAEPVETAYDGSCALYRMNKDGSGLTKLLSGLGNGRARMAICNDRIAIASAFRNPVYVYDFVNFMLCDMEGNVLETIANTAEDRHSWIYKEEEEFTLLVNSIQTDGEHIWASLSESEGDFASSRLVEVRDPERVIAIEAFYAPALVTPDGLYFITANVTDTFRVDDMEYTTVLRFRAADGTERILAHIAHTYVGYRMQLSLQGDQLYLTTRDLFQSYVSSAEEIDPEAGMLLRVNLENGAVDELTDAGFSVCVACDPEFYTPPVLSWQQQTETEEEDYIEGSFLLPDSDVYIFSEEELEIYSSDILALMRNEILARHGYIFENGDYRAYFMSQSWYSENPDFSYELLNPVEMENIETIRALEEREN